MFIIAQFCRQRDRPIDRDKQSDSDRQIEIWRDKETESVNDRQAESQSQECERDPEGKRDGRTIYVHNLSLKPDVLAMKTGQVEL